MKDLNIILYTDGSAIPNPGFCGSGLHGYIYRDTDIDKKSGDLPSKYITTNVGYLESAVVSRTEHKTVLPFRYLDGYVSYKGVLTNNYGEVSAFTKSIPELIKITIDDHTVNTIRIMTDSMYLINIINRIKKDVDCKWKTEVNVNLDLWINIAAILKELNTLDIGLNVDKVKGHSDILGNNIADRLAYLGMIESTKHKEDNFVLKQSEGKYWKPIINRHPFLSYRQLFFINGDDEASNSNSFSIMKYKKDEELGKISHIASYGIVKFHTSNEIVNNIIHTYNHMLNGTHLLSTIDLDVLHGQYFNNYYKLFKDKIFMPDRRAQKTISVLGEVDICQAVRYPGLAKRSFDETAKLSMILDDYANTDTRLYTFLDITDYFFTKTDNNKLKIKIDNKDKILYIDIVIDNKKYKIPLELGVDTIVRNQFRKLETYQPKISLAYIREDTAYVRYYVIIELGTTKDISIWCNLYSNGFLL